MRALGDIVTIYSGIEKLLIGPRATFGGGAWLEFLNNEQLILTRLLGAIEDPNDLDQLRKAADRWLFDDSHGSRRDDHHFLRDIAGACVWGGLGAILVLDEAVRIITPASIAGKK